MKSDDPNNNRPNINTNSVNNGASMKMVMLDYRNRTNNNSTNNNNNNEGTSRGGRTTNENSLYNMKGAKGAVVVYLEGQKSDDPFAAFKKACSTAMSVDPFASLGDNCLFGDKNSTGFLDSGFGEEWSISHSQTHAQEERKDNHNNEEQRQRKVTPFTAAALGTESETQLTDNTNSHCTAHGVTIHITPVTKRKAKRKVNQTAVAPIHHIGLSVPSPAAAATSSQEQTTSSSDDSGEFKFDQTKLIHETDEKKSAPAPRPVRLPVRAITQRTRSPKQIPAKRSSSKTTTTTATTESSDFETSFSNNTGDTDTMGATSTKLHPSTTNSASVLNRRPSTTHAEQGYDSKASRRTRSATRRTTSSDQHPPSNTESADNSPTLGESSRKSLTSSTKRLSRRDELSSGLHRAGSSRSLTTSSPKRDNEVSPNSSHHGGAATKRRDELSASRHGGSNAKKRDELGSSRHGGATKKIDELSSSRRGSKTDELSSSRRGSKTDELSSSRHGNARQRSLSGGADARARTLGKLQHDTTTTAKETESHGEGNSSKPISSSDHAPRMLPLQRRSLHEPSGGEKRPSRRRTSIPNAEMMDYSASSSSFAAVDAAAASKSTTVLPRKRVDENNDWVKSMLVPSSSTDGSLFPSAPPDCLFQYESGPVTVASKKADKSSNGSLVPSPPGALFRSESGPTSVQAEKILQRKQFTPTQARKKIDGLSLSMHAGTVRRASPGRNSRLYELGRSRTDVTKLEGGNLVLGNIPTKQVSRNIRSFAAAVEAAGSAGSGSGSDSKIISVQPKHHRASVSTKKQPFGTPTTFDGNTSVSDFLSKKQYQQQSPMRRPRRSSMGSIESTDTFDTSFASYTKAPPSP